MRRNPPKAGPEAVVRNGRRYLPVRHHFVEGFGAAQAKLVHLAIRAAGIEAFVVDDRVYAEASLYEKARDITNRVLKETPCKPQE